MELVERRGRLRPLADIADGECVEVVKIVFDSVRRFCPMSEMHPGDIFSCEGRTARAIALRREDGECVRIDPFYASFVAIRAQLALSAPPSIGSIPERMI